MKIKIFLIQAILILFSIQIFAITPVNDCMTLNTADETYELSASLLGKTTNCITISASNVIFDMKGHTIQGNGTNYGIIVTPLRENITITNGILDNWGRGISYYYGTNTDTTSTYITNLTILNSTSHSLYLNNFYGTSCKRFEINNISIDGGSFHLQGLINITFLGDGTIDAGQLYVQRDVTKIILNTSNPPRFENLDFPYGFTYINHNNDFIEINDICGSTLRSINNMKIKLKQNQTGRTSTCFTATNSLSNMIIDFGGNTIAGTGIGYGIRLPSFNVQRNMTFQNVILENWVDAIRYEEGSSADTTPLYFNNITIRNTTTNALFLNNYYSSIQKPIYFHNIDIDQGNIFFKGLTELKFTGEGKINGGTLTCDTANQELTIEIPGIPTFKKLIFNSGFTYISNASNKTLIIEDICGSTIRTVNGLTIIITEDQTSLTTSCLADFASSNMIIDFNGHTISGDGTNYGLEMGAGINNVTFKNGNVDNWEQCVRYNSGSSGDQGATTNYFDNMNFTNCGTHSFYLNYFYGTRVKSYHVSNSYFDNTVYLRGVDNGVFYGNNISSGSLFSVASANNIDTDPTINGSVVGNFWQDFTCDNESNFYAVQYNGYNYTVCNENDYSTGRVDTAPLIGIQRIIIANGAEGSSGSSNSGSVAFPLQNFISMIVSIFFILTFLS